MCPTLVCTIKFTEDALDRPKGDFIRSSIFTCPQMCKLAVARLRMMSRKEQLCLRPGPWSIPGVPQRWYSWRTAPVKSPWLFFFPMSCFYNLHTTEFFLVWKKWGPIEDWRRGYGLVEPWRSQKKSLTLRDVIQYFFKHHVIMMIIMISC